VTIAIGVLIGLLYALFTVQLKADYIVTGIAINVLALGLTTYLLRVLFHVKAGLQSTRIAPLPDINFPFLDGLGVVNQVFNNQSLFTYVSWALVVIHPIRIAHPSCWRASRIPGNSWNWGGENKVHRSYFLWDSMCFGRSTFISWIPKSIRY